MTNAVVYYSNTDSSKHIAQYFADKLGYALFDIYGTDSNVFDDLVLVFPVHCQSLPKEICSFLTRIKVQNLTLIATYGRMCRGNALYEVQKKFCHNIVAAAYVPTKHAYLNEGEFDEFFKLEPILKKIKCPAKVKIPKSYKNPFAGVLPKLRSRIGVKLQKNINCDSCGICTQACKNNAINNGIVNKNCIRCLKCVKACPNSALQFSLRPAMRVYLNRKKKNDLIVYI